MKKLYVLSALSLGLFSGLMAQDEIKTYSVYDVNHDNNVTVSDVTPVVNRVLEVASAADPALGTGGDAQVVDAVALNELLSSIKLQLEDLRQMQVQNATRLQKIEEKLGISDPFVESEPGPEFINGHEYVDLGLPSGLKWATCNVGAEKPEDYGLYFAWGETEGYLPDGSDGHSFDWISYKWCNGSRNTLTKYNIDLSSGVADYKNVLDLEDDAAHTYWGGSWRMPTAEEIDELIVNCDWTWTSENGVAGYKVSGNGNYIFLPAAGYREGSTFSGEAFSGNYWSATLAFVNSFTYCAHYLYFISSYHLTGNGGYRCNGHNVRPVTE